MADKLGFLSAQEQVKLPTGGGDFAPSGFVGAMQAKVLYTFMSELDSDTYEGFPEYDIKRPAGSYFIYSFKTPEAAAQGMELLGVEGYQGKKPAAQQVWSFMMNRDTVMNFSDKSKLDAFGQTIVFDAKISTLASAKYRHELHMVALPLAVRAMANLLGYDNAGFSIAELTKKPEDIVFNDEFQQTMIGQGKEHKFQDSLLWQRRAELWASLGELNPDVYLPIGSEKLATTSEKLSTCLRILAVPWATQVYARLITVNDPRVDARSKSDKQLTIPAIYELFGSKKEAQLAADADMERLSKGATNGNGNHAQLEIPEKWQELPEEFAAWVEKTRTEVGKSPTALQIAQLAKKGGITVPEFQAWVLN